MASKAELQFLWYSALQSPFGIVVETDNIERLKAKLYSARSEALDPALQDISLKPSPFNTSQLWLIKRHPDAEERSASPSEAPD